MAHFESKVLPASVTPEWLSKTYSEYLYACAEDAAAVNNAIADACSDDTLEQYIDAYHEVWDANVDCINNALFTYALAKGVALDEIKVKGPDFQVAIADYEPTPEVQEALSNINQQFNYYSTTDEYLAYIASPNMNVDDLIYAEGSIQDRITLLANSISSQFNLADNYSYGLQEGFVNFKVLTKAIIGGTALSTSQPLLSFNLKNSRDGGVGTVTYMLSEVVEQMKDVVSSNIAWAQGFASCAISNVSDRLANFNETIKASFSSAYTEAKETFNNVRAFLSQAHLTVSSFISQAEQTLGWNELTNRASVIAATDVAAYTGTSPWAGMDLHTAKGIANATVQTCVAAGKAIWEGIKKLGKKLWGKVRPYVMAVTNDPEDLAVIDKDATSYEVENWCFHNDEHVGRFEIDFNYSSSEMQNLVIYLSKHIDKTIAFENYAGTVVITLRNFSYRSVGLNLRLIVDYNYHLKPRALKIQRLYDTHIMWHTSDTACLTGEYGEYYDTLPKWTNMPDIYCSDDASEEEFGAGLKCGISMLWSIAAAQMGEWMNAVEFHHGWQSDILIDRAHDSTLYTTPESTTWHGEIIPGCYPKSDGIAVIDRYNFQVQNSEPTKIPSPTNLDFLKMASGYHTAAWSTNEEPWGADSTNLSFGCVESYDGRTTYYRDASDIAAFFACFFVLQQNERRLQPGDFVFLPYTSDTFDFPAPRYAIKTDAQNANIVDVFISVLTIAVVIAIAVLVGKAVCRTISKAKFKKWTKIKGELDNDIWNKKPLSRKQWRKYLRADKKLSKMNLWSKGTAVANAVTGDSPLGSVSSMLSDNTDTEMDSNTFDSWESDAIASKQSAIYYVLTRNNFSR